MIDILVVISYFLLMLLFGWVNRRQNPESYWVAGRTNTVNGITLSLVASIFGASSTMGIIGLGYSRGLTGAWWSLIGGLALIPFSLLLASRVRSSTAYTLPDILKNAYGEKVAIPAGLMIAISWCGIIAAQIIAGGKLISCLFPISSDTALIVVSVAFTLYTFWGGQLSVIKTDAWQFILFTFSLLIVSLLMLKPAMTDRGLWNEVPVSYWDFPVSDAFSWYEILVFYPLIIGLPYLVGPDIYSRIFCARDNQTARKGTLAAAVIIIPISFLLAFVGIMAKAQFPGIQAEEALAAVLINMVPFGLKGIIVVGFLGAIMSSADTCLLSASTILSLNVIKPSREKPKEKELLVTKYIIIILGALAWFIADRQKGIISSLLLGYTVFVGGIVCPTLASLFKDRINVKQSGILWAVIIGGVSALLGKIQDGAILKEVLTGHGQAFLESVLGQKYLSIMPLILSILCILIIGRLSFSASAINDENTNV